MAVNATHPDYDAAAPAWARGSQLSTLNSQLRPAVLTSFIPVLHTNVVQGPVTNLVARPEALAAIDATGSVMNTFAAGISARVPWTILKPNCRPNCNLDLTSQSLLQSTYC
jgi:hypothetical protein